MTGILVYFHCESNTGYAIQRHEYTFSQMAYQLTGSWDKVHFGYPSIAKGRSLTIPDELQNIVVVDALSKDKNHISDVQEYIRKHNIKIAFGFDQPVSRPFYKSMREAGIEYIFSYWGAPMSSINSGLKLMLKRLEVGLHRHKPDYFIFQSHGMKQTATHGRGIAESRCIVVNSGIDTEKFKPSSEKSWYAYDTFSIPRDRKIFYYSGHMEHRKGVHVIAQAAAYLINQLGRKDLHFLIFGNAPGEERAFDKFYKGTAAEQYITFGGYRHDLYQVIPSCYSGCLATTGWDSFPMSTLEITSSGLPLIVSDLLGVRETVVPNETGLRFPPGDYQALANCVTALADNPELRDKLGKGARERVEREFKREMQIANLAKLIDEKTGLFPQAVLT